MENNEYFVFVPGIEFFHLYNMRRIKLVKTKSALHVLAASGKCLVVSGYFRKLALLAVYKIDFFRCIILLNLEVFVNLDRFSVKRRIKHYFAFHVFAMLTRPFNFNLLKEALIENIAIHAALTNVDS